VINQIENRAKQTKPPGITLTAIYFGVVNGLLAFLISIIILFAPGLIMPEWLTLMAAVTLFLSVVSFVACYGLFVLIDWGRKLAIVICAIAIPLNLISLKLPGEEITSGTVLLTVVSIGIDLVIIWYLLQDDIKYLFKNKRAASK